jgi:alpha-1,2-mannosyltransferase
VALLGRSSVHLEAVVILVAVACRLGVILRSGGLRGDFGYDAPLYFAAADALTYGRLPYRDFVFLHPPAQLLVLAPFAWLTRVVSDQTAFAVANVSITVVGATAAVLVVRICRRLGFGRRAALIGGLFYATWFGAVGAEYLTKLEPVGNLFFLGAVLFALNAQRRESPWLWAAAGAALGLAVCVKIWWIVPAVGVVLWQVFSACRVRGGAIVTAGAVAAALLVNLPFFAQAPGQMWASVITNQLGRPRRMDPLPRIRDLGTLFRLDEHISGLTLSLGTLLVGVVFLAAVARAWRVQRARPVVAILAAQLAVLLASPSWFPYYTDYVAGAAAITVAAAATPPPRRRILAGMTRWLPTGFAAAVTVAILVTESVTVRPLPGAAELSRSVAGIRCVMSDAPMGLIELNALSRGLAARCPNWIDVTGRTYGPNKSDLPRSENAGWQRDLTRYLRSGDAILIVRSRETGMSRETLEAISRDGVLARAGGQTVYRVRHP